MFSKRSEINNILKKYGENKGTQFLTYYYSNTYVVMHYFKRSHNDEEIAFVKFSEEYIIKKHGEEYFKELANFAFGNSKNKKLINQLEFAGNEFLDESIYTAFINRKK